jgi:hypothetical protein
MDWPNNVAEYLKELLGQEFAMMPVHENEMHGLPLYLTKAYTPYELLLFERKIIVLQTIAKANESPARIAKDVATLRKHFEKDVAVVFSNLAPWERKRLIEKQVPFIVPRRQLYLPMFLLDLREYFPRVPVSSQEYLSRAAQHALLRQILFGDLKNRQMGEVANLLGYSAMMATKIRDELVALDLCTVEANGRSRQIVFPDPFQLWSKGMAKMRSPVFRKHFLTGNISDVQLASTDALAKHSLLEPDELTTFAVWKKNFRGVVKENTLVEIQSEDGADLVLEEWYYDPRNLSDDSAVDPLSLYLALRDNSDERVQIALEEMMEKLPWSKD